MALTHLSHRLSSVALPAIIAAAALAGCATQNTAAPMAGDNQPQPVIINVPVQVTAPELKAGCWVQFFGERNFGGDMITLVGPAQLDTLDKETGRQLKRDIDSLVVGPKATLTVYQHQLFKDRSRTFGANARQGGLIAELGFGGRIESFKLDCLK